MKTRSILMTTLYSLMLGIGFTACSEDDNEPELPSEPETYPVYILNEGLWGAKNANITSFIPNYKAESLSDVFVKVNGTKMGDVANAMMKEDDNIYILLNGSKYVARLDQGIKEQARYTFSETEGAPRCIDVEDDYAYVTQYGGQVSKINIKDMTLDRTFKGGDNLEGIIEKDGKLYVANSYKSIYEYNKEVYVINAQTMTLETTIEVVENPTKLFEIDNKIYLISAGNYADVPSALQVIDTKAGTSKRILNDVTKITEGPNGLIYGVKSMTDWSTTPANYTHTFFTYNPSTGSVNESSFLQDVPSALSTVDIYLLEVDEKNGFIYVGTSDYTTNGTIYQFDKNGKLIQSFDSGGINPSAMVFVN